MKQYSRPVFHSLSGALALAALFLLPQPAHAWVAVGETGADFKALATDSRGFVTAVGQLTDGSGGNALYVAHYSVSGKLLWRASEPGGTFDRPAEALAVAADAKGDVYVSGALPLAGGAAVPVVAKYSGASGKRVWLTAADTRAGQAETLVLDAGGRLVVGGYVLDADGPHCFIAGVSGSGALSWSWSVAPGEIRDLALDANGDVYGTGRILGVKLSGATGGEIWRVHSSGTAQSSVGFPLMRSISVDRSGSVVAAGALSNSLEETRTFYTAALNADTGAVTWEWTGSPVYGGDTAVDVATDVSGKLFAAGELAGNPAILCLDSAKGAPGWSVQPWQADPGSAVVPAVAALSADSRAAYVSGVSTGGSWAVAGVNRTGKVRWRANLGAGHVAAQGVDDRGHLFLTGRLAVGKDGSQQPVVIGLAGSTGKQLPGSVR